MSGRGREASLLPRWTKRVVTKLGGRDPLGLSRLAQLLSEGLMPGIITTRNRARYYALYCWILWHIEQEDNPQSSAEFVAAFQRREAAIALATRLLGDDHETPIGLLAVNSKLEMARDEGRIDTAFQVLPANRLGGFGQYYAGCLYNLSLTYRTPDGVDRITEGAAQDLAAAVHEVVGATPYVRDRYFARTLVPIDVLEASAERLSINAITAPFAREERDLLVSLFFGDLHGELDDETRSRRESLLRILATVDAYEKAGIEIAEKTLPMQLVYYPAYFGAMCAGTSNPVPIQLPTSLTRCSEHWRQFALHQYLTQSLEGLLASHTGAPRSAHVRCHARGDSGRTGRCCRPSRFSGEPIRLLSRAPARKVMPDTESAPSIAGPARRARRGHVTRVPHPLHARSSAQRRNLECGGHGA